MGTFHFLFLVVPILLVCLAATVAWDRWENRRDGPK